MATHDSNTYLDLAARAAMRGAGYVEPNPMVGAVVARDGVVIGVGHHRRFGGLHAEREALADCRRRGEDPRGATAYVTLEPCCHFGKQPPCTDALIEAGVARVVAARRDPNPVSGGGAEVLERAGIEVEFVGESRLALSVSDPFVKRITTGLPWVIAKWAQFEDGRMLARPGEDRWISNEWARRRVHRLRGRVDAIVTGVGTVIADDPMLTVRGVKARRTPARVVLDAELRMPLEAAIVRSVREVRTIFVCKNKSAGSARAEELRRLGVEVWSTQASRLGVNLVSVLRKLSERLEAANVLVEAGPTLLRAAFAAGVVDEAVVHVAMRNQGDGPADLERAPAVEGLIERRRKRVGDTEERVYRMPRSAHPGLGGSV
jgi:diaminohydroxyphosphoribosylaminopyrimidine deaminase/5-amino-6-(5-phosphoribosylamino)uracil reductase